MDPHVSEWLNLVVRWIHVITGIAWIGASFYFNWLLNHLTRPDPGEAGEAGGGELWAIHAGGFFQVRKLETAPGALLSRLHWFKWEAYWTWISGFALLVLVYYMGARVFLIDPGVADIGVGAAVAIGVGVLVLGWFVYDFLWRSPLAEFGWAAAVSLGLLVGLAYGLGQVFSGRGAYIHVGAILGTLMAGNVLRVIMPAQRAMVSAAEAGGRPDPVLAADAERRSLHNTYMTLPVLFIMVSNHYPATFGHRYGWLVLVALFAVGAAVRHYFNFRHRGNWSHAWVVAAAAVGTIAIVAATAPTAWWGSRPGDPGAAVSFAEARHIIVKKCLTCHSRQPTHEAFDVAPKDVKFDTPEQIRAQVDRIRATAVVTETMPLGNLTEMTAEERAQLGRWIDQGAPIN